jgi:2-polyprenyl-3-methyl-5-hydroxy-6-metoxy-1,4-benzoquinol methylase
MNIGNTTKRNSYFKYRSFESTTQLDTHSLPVIYLRDKLPKNKDAEILDIGCGYGHLMQLVKNSGYTNISGIDIEKDALGFCKKNKLEVEEVESIQDFAKKTTKKFDFIIMTHVIEHIKKDQVIETLQSIKSILKENGKLYLTTPNAQSRTGAYWAYEDFTHELVFTSGSLFYILKAAGFENIRFIDQDGLENSKFSLLKKLLLSVYKWNDVFWNKITGGAYHPGSPKIYTWELKIIAS